MFDLWKKGSLAILFVTALIQGVAHPVNPPDQPQKLRENQRQLTDLYGDPLPPGAIARMGTTRFRHADWISCATLAQDGTIVASAGGEDKLLYLWDAPTGIELRRIKGHRGRILDVALSPNAKILASCSEDGTLRLWDVSTGEESHRLPFKGRGNIRFSPDGEILAAGGETIILWRVATGKILRELEMPGRVAFSSDGSTLAIAGAGRVIAGAGDVIRLLDAKTSKEIGQVSWHPNQSTPEQITCIAISPDARLLAVGITNGSIKLLETATGNEVRVISWNELMQPNEHRVYSPGPIMAFSPDGKVLVTGGSDCRFTRWDLKTGRELSSLENQPKCAGSLSFSRDGNCLAIHDGGSIHLWNANTGKNFHSCARHEDAVLAVAFSPDGRVVASASADHTIRLWEPSTGKELTRLVGHGNLVRSIAFSVDGRTLASGSADDTVRLWQVASGKQLSLIETGQDGVNCVVFSPNGESLVSGGYKNCIRCWDLRTGKQLGQFGHEHTEARCVAFSPNGKSLVSTNEDRFGDRAYTVREWDFATGEERRTFPGRPSAYGAWPAAFTSDGKLLAIGDGDRIVRFWEMATGTECSRIDLSKGTNRCVAFCRDNRVLATASAEDGSVCLWEVLTGKRIHCFTGHLAQVSTLCFSPKGSSLASGSWDSTTLLWDISGLGPASLVHLPHQELDELWSDLCSTDGSRAYRAVGRLVAASGQSVTFLQKRLRPSIESLDALTVGRLIKDLDNDAFTVREKATLELEKLGTLVASHLQHALAGDPPPEVRERVKGILAKLKSKSLSAEQLRTLRAIHVLERIGSAAARETLENLAKGNESAIETQNARESLQRLKRR